MTIIGVNQKIVSFSSFVEILNFLHHLHSAVQTETEEEEKVVVQNFLFGSLTVETYYHLHRYHRQHVLFEYLNHSRQYP